MSLRKSTGWLSLFLKETVPLKTSIEIPTEYWLLLKNYSEIKDNGFELLRKNNVSEALLEKTFKRFRAFIRQAENYYISAKSLQPRSSSLLYYYSFLNLAKAYLVIRNPLIPNDVSHGLVRIKKGKNHITKDQLKINSQGKKSVFQELYQLEFKKKLTENSIFKVADFFGYVTDIGFQISKLRICQRKIFPCKLVFLTNTDTKETWGLLAIPKETEILKYKKTFSNLHRRYESVEIENRSERMTIKELFNIEPIEQSIFNYFQQKKPFISEDENLPTNDVAKLVQDALEPMISYSLVEDSFNFNLNLPLKLNNQKPFNEFLSIYVLMFYFGDLVRYRPDYLEELLESEYNYILESFVQSVHLKFVRLVTSKILDVNFVISSF